MAQSMLVQFTNMLNSRFALGADRKPFQKMNASIRETVTYPKFKVADDNDSCLNPSLSSEHVLSCGHIISTPSTSEPCAPNCHHIANKASGMDRSLKNKKAMQMKNGKGISTKSFYCDACVETEIEAEIPAAFSAPNAEERRATLRVREATARKKASDFRKCYIGQKVTSIPCHSDGSLSSRYQPRVKHHPFDTSLPQIGDNMFEDVDPNPEKTDEVTASTKRKSDGVGASDYDVDTEETRTLSVESDGANEQPQEQASNRGTRRAQRLAASIARPSPGSAGRTRTGLPGDSVLQDFETATSQRSRRLKYKRVHSPGAEGDDDVDQDDQDAPPTKRTRLTPETRGMTKK
jgi:hypothetical protein